jgi:hypothetical protein
MLKFNNKNIAGCNLYMNLLHASLGFSYKVTIVEVYDIWHKQKQSNLRKTTTLVNQEWWPLLTSGRCSEVALCYEN